MTPADRAAAQAALTEGRGVYGRLDQIRGPEDAAADILDLWKAAESAMRAMLGGSTLSGQALVRELRQRGSIGLEQANALASFWDARVRVEDVGYKPTLTDVGYARVGYNELTHAINETGSPATQFAPAQPTIAGAAASAGYAASAAPGVGTGAGAAPIPGSRVPPAGPGTAGPAASLGSASVPPMAVPPVGVPSRPAQPARARGRRVLPVPYVLAGLVLLAIIGAAAYMMSGGSSYSREQNTAVGLLTSGRTESARAAFNKLAHDYPDQAMPHVFMARFARQDGDPAAARQELTTAIRLDPNNEVAQREMGLLLLSENDPQLARNFFLRAVKLNPNDSAAQGYLGCALLRLNLIEAGQRFLSRAGPGTWSSCTAVPAPVAASPPPPR